MMHCFFFRMGISFRRAGKALWTTWIEPFEPICTVRSWNNYIMSGSCKLCFDFIYQHLYSEHIYFDRDQARQIR